MNYEEKLENIKILENRWQDAFNQTAVYSLVKNHFHSPLPEGKTVKKAVVIGYDGCTCEMLAFADTLKESAVKYLVSNGGHGVFSFAGGRPYPEPISQDTSTGPGWCSMLTGTLSNENNITGNDIIKKVEPKTLFIELIEEKVVKSTAFYVSWNGHFERKNATYLDEKKYIADNGLNAVFKCAKGDSGTVANTIKDIKKPVCSDFIFTILEYPDHFGHKCDYLPEQKKYMKAYESAEKAGMKIIKAVENRPTFEKEDWLVLITSDHGGINRDHGGNSLEERITFIVSNKELL